MSVRWFVVALSLKTRRDGHGGHLDGDNGANISERPSSCHLVS